MDRRDDCAGPLFATDSEEEGRSRRIRATDEGFGANKGTSKRYDVGAIGWAAILWTVYLRRWVMTKRDIRWIQRFTNNGGAT